MRNRAAVLVAAMAVLTGGLGLVACSSSGSDDSVESLQGIVAGPSADFCSVYAGLPTDTPEDYVGSAGHVADLDRLLAASSPSLAPKVLVLRDFVASGAVTSDSDTNLTENWPVDVRTAVEEIRAFGSSAC